MSEQPDRNCWVHCNENILVTEGDLIYNGYTLSMVGPQPFRVSTLVWSGAAWAFLMPDRDSPVWRAAPAMPSISLDEDIRLPPHNISVALSVGGIVGLRRTEVALAYVLITLPPGNEEPVWRLARPYWAIRQEAHEWRDFYTGHKIYAAAWWLPIPKVPTS